MNKFTVYYDGACPLCRREIGFYQGRRGSDAIDWVDISSDPSRLGPDLSCEAALRRFHVRDRTGQLLDGAKAFAALWREMPGFRWLGRLVRIPPILWLAERSYNLFLKIRPSMQRFAGRLEARS